MKELEGQQKREKYPGENRKLGVARICNEKRKM